MQMSLLSKFQKDYEKENYKYKSWTIDAIYCYLQKMKCKKCPQKDICFNYKSYNGEPHLKHVVGWLISNKITPTKEVIRKFKTVY